MYGLHDKKPLLKMHKDNIRHADDTVLITDTDAKLKLDLNKIRC